MFCIRIVDCVRYVHMCCFLVGDVCTMVSALMSQPTAVLSVWGMAVGLGALLLAGQTRGGAIMDSTGCN